MWGARALGINPAPANQTGKHCGIRNHPARQGVQVGCMHDAQLHWQFRFWADGHMQYACFLLACWPAGHDWCSAGCMHSRCACGAAPQLVCPAWLCLQSKEPSHDLEMPSAEEVPAVCGRAPSTQQDWCTAILPGLGPVSASKYLWIAWHGMSQLIAVRTCSRRQTAALQPTCSRLNAAGCDARCSLARGHRCLHRG